MKMKALRCLGVILLLPGPVFSAPTDSNEILRFFAEEAQVQAAAKHSQKTSDAPATAQVITAQDIAAYGYRTLAEALQSLPGIHSWTDRNYTGLWVRGFGRPGDYNNRVLLLINGHRMNDNIYGQAFAGFDFSLDLAAVERIEVVKGPGSALYGDNAFFGVVNVVTKTARRSPAARTKVETGSYGTHAEFGEISRLFKDEWDAYAAGSFRHMRGQDLAYPDMTDADGGHTAYNADREENYTLFTSLSRPGWSLQGGVDNRAKRIPTASFGTVFNNNGTYTTDSRRFVELAMQDLKINDVMHLSGRWYYDWYGYHGDWVSANDAPPPDNLLYKDHARASWYGEELCGRFTFFGAGNPLLVGQDFEKNLLGRQGVYIEGQYPPLFEDDRTEYRYAFFGQQELELLPDLRLTLGLRYDRYQSFGGTWNPRFAMVYHPWREGSLKLLYGSAFRAPSVYERYYAAPPNIANPALHPETIRTYEAVWEQGFGVRRSASVSYFQSRIANLIDQESLPDGSIQYVNKDKVRSEGMELYGKTDLTKDMSGYLGYTIQSTRVSGGDRMSNSPTHTAKLGLSRRSARGKARVSADGFLISSRTTFQGSSLPPAAVLNLNVRVQPWWEGLTVYGGVFNVLDAAYSASGAAENAQADIPQDGRNFNVGLEYRFGKPYEKP